MNKSQLIQIAANAAIEAGNEILKVYNSEFSVDYKEDRSPLTMADLRANEAIIRELTKTGIPIISEEIRQTDHAIRKEWSRCWMVDPLDGTKEFVSRNGEFTVNIALITGTKPEFGLIYVPVSGELYLGDVVTERTYKLVLTGSQVHPEHILSEENIIIPSSQSNELLRVVGSRSHMNVETMNYIEELKKIYKEVEMVSKGSSLKFCLLAEGKADLYPRFSPTMEWDTAAGQAICEASGFRVVDQKTMKSMRYNKESLVNNSFIVSR